MNTREMPRITPDMLDPAHAAHRPGRRHRRRDRRHERGRTRHALRTLTIWALALLAVAVVTPRVLTWAIARGDIAHQSSDIPRLAVGEHRAAIVLGAGLVGDRPSRLLDQRIEAAVDLLEDERVDVLVMSGDNSTEYYDEPTAMRTRAIELGAPAGQVAADYAGRRTWDTCVRAHDIFGLDEAVVVTSSFHVDRTVTTCNAAGVDATGMSVSDSSFSLRDRAAWRVRELAATGRALVDAWAIRPEPAVGGDAIDPWNPCEIQRSLAPSDAARDERMTGLTCD